MCNSIVFILSLKSINCKSCHISFHEVIRSMYRHTYFYGKYKQFSPSKANGVHKRRHVLFPMGTSNLSRCHENASFLGEKKYSRGRATREKLRRMRVVVTGSAIFVKKKRGAPSPLHRVLINCSTV